MHMLAIVSMLACYTMNYTLAKYFFFISFLFSPPAPKIYWTVSFVHHYPSNIREDFYVMEEMCIAELPSTDRGRATDSCMLGCKTQWLHERESKAHTEEQRGESIRGSDFFLSLHQLGIIWPTVAWYICPTCLPIFFYLCSMPLSLSVFHLLTTSLHPSHLAHFAITLPYSVCVCVCVRRIISELDVCQNKGLISFTKN